MAETDIKSLFEDISTYINIGDFENFETLMKTVEGRKKVFDSVSPYVNIADYLS